MLSRSTVRSYVETVDSQGTVVIRRLLIQKPPGSEGGLPIDPGGTMEGIKIIPRLAGYV